MSFRNAKFPPSDNQYYVVLNPAKTFSLSPAAGYFILNNWVIGINSSVSTASNEDDQGNSMSSKSFEVGPATRYYFRFGKFAVFPEFVASWGQGKAKYVYAESPFFGNPAQTIKYNVTSSTYKGGIGLAWFVANNVSLEGILSYSSDTNGVKDSNSAYITPYDASRKVLAFTVGLQFFVPARSGD